VGHANISVMRVDTGQHIVHAKDINYLKSAGNGTGVFSLVMDWYSLSLANVVFAWRRDTHLTSTFAQVLSASNCPKHVLIIVWIFSQLKELLEMKPLKVQIWGTMLFEVFSSCIGMVEQFGKIFKISDIRKIIQ
jgi:hypothetical protein